MMTGFTPMTAARFVLSLLTVLATVTSAESTELPSWQDVASRAAIVEFVAAVTDPDSDSYVPPAERIAVFDNDGTLWSEQPFYFQLAFALDRMKALAPRHPEWREQQPYKGGA